MKTYIILLISFLFFTVTAQQQQPKADKDVENLINKGLQAYDRADYNKAELNFRKAMAKDPVNAIASYNLGLTETEMDKNLEGAHFFEKAAKHADDPMLKSKAYFNEGNVWYNKKKYDKAVEAYKNALRQNPEDEEARYNLALAQQKLKQQQKNNKKNQKNKKDKQNKDQKNKQNKEQNKKDQQKNKQNQDKKDQNKQNKKDQNNKGKGDQKKDQNKENKGDKNKKQEGKQDKDKQKGGNKGENQQKKQGEGEKRKAKLTPQQVKQLLVALKNKEQKTQKKIKAKILKGKGKKKKQEKDW